MKSALSRHSKLIVSYVCLITLLAVFPSYAEPEQRIIIHFKQALSDSNKIEISDLINKKLSNGFKLTEHSNDLRWIIILPGRLDTEQQNIFKGELLKNKLIKHVELDKLLEKTVTINAQLLPL